MTNLQRLREYSEKKALIVAATGFRFIIGTVANRLGNIRAFELLPKLKTEKLSNWCTD